MKKLTYIILALSFLLYPAAVYFDDQFPQWIEQQRQVHLEKVRQKNCLKQALWYEARGEPELGIRAVATVIINRVNSSRYPNDFCSVIHQHKQFSYVWQLQHQGKPLEIKPKKVEYTALQRIENITEEIFEGNFRPIFGHRVMWYHTTRVSPKWTHSKKTVKVIGSHIFKES